MDAARAASNFELIVIDRTLPLRINQSARRACDFSEPAVGRSRLPGGTSTRKHFLVWKTIIISRDLYLSAAKVPPGRRDLLDTTR
jgi:hypothetical protein